MGGHRWRRALLAALLVTAGAAGCRDGGDDRRRDGAAGAPAAGAARASDGGGENGADGSRRGDPGPGGAAGGGGAAATDARSGAGAGAGTTDAAGPVTAGAPPREERDPRRPPGWRRIASAPLSGRHAHRAVWTGKEMIVWGGASRAGNAAIYHDDGAAYDPAADRWRAIAASPLSPRADHVAAWTGKEMLVWGGQPGPGGGGVSPVDEGLIYVNEFTDGAAYDPATNRWRTIERFPLAPRWGARAVWTGTALVVWGGARAEDGEDGRPLNDGAAYDPATDRWTELPPAPIAGRTSPLAAPVDGGALFSWGYGPGNRADPGSARYDVKERRWSPAAPPPDTDSAWCFDLAGCIGVDIGSRVVFAGEGLVYDEKADQWSRIAPNRFASPFLDGKATAWTGNSVFVWGGGEYEGEYDAPPARVAQGPAGALYDPGADRWEPLHGAPIAPRARGRAVWTGAEVIVWGGESAWDARAQYADGAAWSP